MDGGCSAPVKRHVTLPADCDADGGLASGGDCVVPTCPFLVRWCRDCFCSPESEPPVLLRFLFPVAGAVPVSPKAKRFAPTSAGSANLAYRNGPKLSIEVAKSGCQNQTGARLRSTRKALCNAYFRAKRRPGCPHDRLRGGACIPRIGVVGSHSKTGGTVRSLGGPPWEGRNR